MTGQSVPNQYILISSNIIKEFESVEQIAFIIGMRILDFYSNEVNNKMNDEFVDFVNQCITANKNIYNDYYSEVLQFALKDIKAGIDPSQVFLINPFFRLNFEKQYYNFLNSLNQIALKESIDKITETVNMMAKSGYNLKKLTNFPFDKISTQILVNVKVINLDKWR